MGGILVLTFSPPRWLRLVVNSTAKKPLRVGRGFLKIEMERQIMIEEQSPCEVFGHKFVAGLCVDCGEVCAECG